MEKGRERDLLARARAFMRDALGFDKGMVLEEVPSPWGRPDLLGVRFPSRHPPCQRPIGRGALCLISFLEMQGRTGVDEISNRFGMTRRSVANLASGPLVDSLLSFDGCTLGLGRRPLSPLGHICAVEIKLRDWKAGLAQAVRYKTFSDEVYVFLGRMPRAPLLHAFRRFGIGLVQLAPEPAFVLGATDTSSENVTMSRRIVEANISRLMRSSTRTPF